MKRYMIIQRHILLTLSGSISLTEVAAYNLVEFVIPNYRIWVSPITFDSILNV